MLVHFGTCFLWKRSSFSDLGCQEWFNKLCSPATSKDTRNTRSLRNLQSQFVVSGTWSCSIIASCAQYNRFLEGYSAFLTLFAMPQYWLYVKRATCFEINVKKLVKLLVEKTRRWRFKGKNFVLSFLAHGAQRVKSIRKITVYKLGSCDYIIHIWLNICRHKATNLWLYYTPKDH